jgi:tRNA G46 methylase TrmB
MSQLNNLFKKNYLFIYPRNWYLRSRLSNRAYVLGLNKAGFGGRGVFVKRDAIEPELVHLALLLAGRNSFLDIGANTGVYSLKAAKVFNGTGVVIACEPFTGVYQSLIKSVEYNNFKNVRLRNVGVGEAKGLQEFFMNFGKPNSFSLF